MFTLPERRQVDELIRLGYVDTFRHLHADRAAYTWWPYMAKARERNIGWRIDYVFAHTSLIPKISRADISGHIQGSDHCPILIELDAT